MITLSIWISMPNLTGGPPYGGIEEYIMLQHPPNETTMRRYKRIPTSRFIIYFTYCNTKSSNYNGWSDVYDRLDR